MATANASPEETPADGTEPLLTGVRPLRRPARHRHRADAEGSGRQRLGFVWGLAAAALTALLGAAALQRTPRPGEGVLAASAFLLTHSGTEPGLPSLSPDGVGALHLALYATLTRAFSRDHVLISAGREVLLVSAVLSAALIWRVARRLGLGSAAAAVAIVFAALPLLVPATALLDVPAQLAVPWSVAAAWAATAGRRILRPVLVLPALAVAALLAPAVLVPALAAAAVATVPAGRVARRPARTAGALGLVVAAAVLAGLLSAGYLGPEAARSAASLSTTATRLVAVCFLLVGGIAAWTLSAFRVPAIALVAGGVAALLPLDRLAMLLVCVPLAAVLAAALLSRLTDELTERGPATIRRAVQVGAAVVLAALAGMAVLSLIRGSASAPSARGATDLLRWTHDELPTGTPVLAPPVEWAELVRAGADEKQFRLHGTTADPHLQVVVGAPPPGAVVLSRLPGGPGRPVLLLVDRRPGVPTAAELARRHALAAALRANPTTTTGPRAAAVLDAASVDERLLTLLAALGAQFGVGVRDLPQAVGAPNGTLTRYALIDRIGKEPLVPGSAANTRLLAWLSAQLPPFHPDSVQVTNGGVLLGFRYVSAPDALVSAAVR